MGIWEWVTAVLAIWGAVSILLAVAWTLGGKRIFRKPPQPPRFYETVVGDKSVDTVSDILLEVRRRERQNGGS